MHFLACSSPCAACSGSATTCTGCSGSKPYLYGSTCVASCPSGYYATTTNSCAGMIIFDLSILITIRIACSSPCATCSGTASTCTGCISSSSHLYNSNCYATCPSGSYASSSSACTSINNCHGLYLIHFLACSSPCATCSGSATSCTGCSGSKPYLYSSTCVATCPSGYYATTANSCAGMIFSNFLYVDRFEYSLFKSMCYLLGNCINMYRMHFKQPSPLQQ
jgi:hypothetical protein